MRFVYLYWNPEVLLQRRRVVEIWILGNKNYFVRWYKIRLCDKSQRRCKFDINLVVFISWIKLSLIMVVAFSIVWIFEQNEDLVDLFILDFCQNVVLLSIEYYHIQFIVASLDFANEELICFLVIVRSAHFVENILLLVVFQVKFFKTDVFLDLPSFIELYTSVNFLAKIVHLIPLLLMLDLGLIVVRDMIVSQLKVGYFKFALLKLFYLHQRNEEMLKVLVRYVVVKSYCQCFLRALFQASNLKSKLVV